MTADSTPITEESPEEPSLTLVMPTRNRPALVRRALSFYADHGLSTRILIADGSDADRAREVKEVCLAFSDELDLAHLPSNRSFIDRVGAALSTVETDCVAMVGDDDFFVPSVLTGAAQELRSKPSLAAVTGRALTVLVTREGSGRTTLQVRTWPQFGYAEDAPEKRLRAYLGRSSTFYVVRRTAAAAATFSDMARLEFDAERDPVFVEHYDATSLLLAGSISMLERLLFVRQVGLADSAGASLGKGSQFNRIADRRWRRGVRDLEELAARTVSKQLARWFVRRLVGRNVVQRLAPEVELRVTGAPPPIEVELTADDISELAPILQAIAASGEKE